MQYKPVPRLVAHFSLMEPCWALVAIQVFQRDLTYTYSSATRQANRLIPMVGQAQAPIRGRTISASRCGWRIQRWHITARRFIHRVIHLVFLQRLPQASSLTMVRSTSVKLPPPVGRSLLPGARKGMRSVMQSRVLRQQIAPRNGLYRRVPLLAYIQCMFASLL